MNEEKSRREKILDGAAVWAAYYRAFPDEFAKDYLHQNLKLFQRLLLILMSRSTVFVFIAARGLGKSFISAIFLCIRCILYPGTKVCIASGTRGQSINILEKITRELIPNSPELALEISDIKMNGTNAYIEFKNTSYIKVVTAAESGRGNRANVLMLDEFRLIDKNTIDTILRKFLIVTRTPEYSELDPLSRAKALAREQNMTIYASSAFFQDSWSYEKCLDTFRAMLSPNHKQAIVSLPYELAIAEGLLRREAVEEEMMETSFNEIKFSMEMEAMFYGSTRGSFFEFKDVSKNRHIKYPMVPDSVSNMFSGGSKLKIQPKKSGEKRILSADIALMSSKKRDNDASAIVINQLMPTRSGKYISNVVYTDTAEGMRTEGLALMIRKLYEEFFCDYIVLDTRSVGLSVYDALSKDIIDPDTGESYQALSCYNNDELEERCVSRTAPKVIWSINATNAFNSECAIMLREGFKSGKIRLLLDEYNGEKELRNLPGFKGLNEDEQMRVLLPYIHTTLMIKEIVELQHEESGGLIKVHERSGNRKDRYSSMSYNYYVACMLENKLRRKSYDNNRESEVFAFRAPCIRKR